MTLRDLIQVLTMLIALTAIAPIIGRWIASVLSGERHVLHFLAKPMEGLIEKTLGRETYHREMGARDYLAALLCFNGIGLIFLFLLQMLQGILPMNSQQLPAPSWHLAFNSAVSFVTNTNWQSYAGEVTYSRLVQMLGFGVQNFVSAATGISVLLVITRALHAKPGSTPDASKLGNFWRDLTRSTVTVFLPLSIVFSFVLVSQGVVQTFRADQKITTLEGAEQTIPLGPVASQISIKQLGTNGGGYFNANSSHPLENPTPLSNFLECLAILLMPAALVFTFGILLGRPREAWTLYGVMMFLLATGLVVSLWSEFNGNTALGAQAAMEGKDVRFGIANSVLWSAFTTAASNGSVNAMHSSLTPLAGLVAIFNMMLGEIIFGGVGSGLYGMLLFVLLTVFLAGLMVGRTPEYLGRKIEAYEIKMVLIGLLAPSCTVLFFAAMALVNDFGLSSLAGKGPHGLSEILYAFLVRESRTSALYEMTKVLSTVHAESQMAAGALDVILRTFGIDGIILGAQPGLGTKILSGRHGLLTAKTQALADWVFTNGKAAGIGTDTLSATGAYAAPVVSSTGTLAVLIVPNKPEGLEAEFLLEGLLRQLALAMDRARLTEVNEKMRLVEASEHLYQTVLNSVSHELKTPLTTLIGAAGVLVANQTAIAQPEFQSLVDDMNDAATRMKRVVENLLDVSRLSHENGYARVDRQLVDWNDHVTQSVSLMKHDLRHHGLELNLVDRPILVLIDEKLMEHAIGNLIANSINYAPRGTTILIETDLEASATGILATFAISDQGPGILEEHQDRIFEKFYRVPGSRPGGTGLGLALVRQILEEHGGSIRLDTKYKKGARFILRVPTSEVKP